MAYETKRTNKQNTTHREHWALNVQITNIGIKQLLDPFNWTRNRWHRIVHSLLTKRLQCCRVLFVFVCVCFLVCCCSCFLSCSRFFNLFCSIVEQLRETVQKLTQRVTVTSLFKSFLHFILVNSLVFVRCFSRNYWWARTTETSRICLLTRWNVCMYVRNMVRRFFKSFATAIKATNRLVSIDLNVKIWYATPASKCTISISNAIIFVYWFILVFVFAHICMQREKKKRRLDSEQFVKCECIVYVCKCIECTMYNVHWT